MGVENLLNYIEKIASKKEITFETSIQETDLDLAEIRSNMLTGSPELFGTVFNPKAF